MKKYFKKLLGGTLGIASILSLAACNIPKPGQDEINWDVDLNNKIELKAIYPNSGLSNEEFKNSYTTKLYEEITGYKVNYEQILDQDNSKVITNIIATRDPYHVLKLDTGTYGTLQEQDAFLPLNELLERYGQNILEIIPKEAWASATAEDGKIYGIPEVGFSGMLSYALAWDMTQLKAVGIDKVPYTITEVNDALYKLQAKYGSDSSYHALAMQGSQADIEVLSSAWDLPDDYFVDENNEIKSYIYHENYQDYLLYLNQLQRDSIISKEWQGYTQTNILNNFVNSKIGCGYLPYWNANTLYESLAAVKGITVEEAQKMVGIQLYCLGDGSFGSEVQSEPKFKASVQVAYFNAIPSYMAKDAVYIMDWLNKKITDEAYDLYVAGKKGVHYEELTEAEVSGGVPEGYFKVELPDRVVYRKPTEKFEKEVLTNSMYANGTNVNVAKANWPLRESIYNAWDILVDETSPNAIKNPFSFAPIIKNWSNVEMSARSYILTLEQGIVNAKDVETAKRGFETQKTNYEKKFWNDANQYIQDWWKNKK